MIPLSTATKQIKNALADGGAWIVLLMLTDRHNTTTLRLCSNIDDVVFQGHTYTAFPFEIEEVTESNKGELPTVDIVLSNVDRLVQAYVEQDEDYGSGWHAHIDIVHTSAIDQGIQEVYYDFVTMNATADVDKVVFTCGLRNPIRLQFPRVKMMPNGCQNTFKKGACNYTGNDATCRKTLEACREKFPYKIETVYTTVNGVPTAVQRRSTLPFFGFPGIPTIGIYK